MSFQDALRSAVIQNYANFQGRALRSEYWYFMLTLFVATIVASVIDINMIGRPILESVVSLGTHRPLSLRWRPAPSRHGSIGLVATRWRRAVDRRHSADRLACVDQGSAGDNRFGKPPQGQRPALI